MPNTWQRDRARRRAARAVAPRDGTTIDLTSDDELFLADDAIIRQAREDVAALIAPELRFAIEAFIGGDDNALPENREIDLTGPERRDIRGRLERAAS